MKSPHLLCFIFAGLLSACTSQPMSERHQNTSVEPYAPAPMQEAKVSAIQAESASAHHLRMHQQLGTKWGDDLSSYVQHVNLKRLSNQPLDETQVRYASQQFSGRRINSISLVAGKISFSIVDDRGRNLALYREGQRYFLSGQHGQSYQLRYSNSSAQTFEVVASVDGLDVLDGRKASRQKSGYVLRPYHSISIDGFRKSNSSVAAFTFSEPEQSYAANTIQGSIQNTGVIGTVIYELKAPRDTPKIQQHEGYAPAPNAFPEDQ